MKTNLRYLLLIRMIAIGGQILALAVMQSVFAIHLPLIPVISIIVVVGIFTLFSWQRLKTVKDVSERSYVVQLLIDILALTILVYFTGGSANPFISLFILPIVFAAASIRPPYTLLITLCAIGCYTFLMFFNVPVMHSHSHDSGAQLHIWGMWYGFLLSAFLVAYFVARIARALRARDRALAIAREEALAADKAVALGTLAAGTAHELGTPLSTIAVLCKEMASEQKDNPELNHDLGIIREQIDSCKSILQRMASDAGQSQADAGHVIPISQYLNEIIQNWQKLRPEIAIDVHSEGQGEGPDIIAERTLTQAIINILNNAADASVHAVEMHYSWSDNNLLIKVKDDGDGLHTQTNEKVGKEIFSTKTEGLGLGLFLAQTTLSRIGGKFDLLHRDEGGTNAVIEIPLKPILAT